MSAITLQLPDDLAGLLAKYEDRLPEILERGIRNLEETKQDLWNAPIYECTTEIFEFLASLPGAEEVVKFKASDRLEQRVHALLEKNRNEQLTPQEQEEWEHYELVEDLVRLAKVRAAVKLGAGSAKHA